MTVMNADYTVEEGSSYNWVYGFRHFSITRWKTGLYENRI